MVRVLLLLASAVLAQKEQCDANGVCTERVKSMQEQFAEGV